MSRQALPVLILALVLAAVLVPVTVSSCAGSGGTVDLPGSGGSTATGSGGAGSGGATGSGGSTATGSGGAGSGGATGSGGSGAGGASATTGAGGASATTGAGGTSATTGAGGSAVVGCRAGLRFCDDFEAGTTGAAPPAARWATHFNGTGTIAVDDSVAAHSGTKSIHVHHNDSSYQTFFILKGAPAFPAPAGRLYLRVFIRLDVAMSGGHNTYFEAGIDGMTDSQHETRVGPMFGMLMINQPAGDRGVLSHQNYYNDHLLGAQFTPRQWTCVEALFDSTASEVDFWVDGAEVPDLHVTDWQQDPFNSFRFGFEKYAGPAIDIWYDDIAVDTQKVGCN